MAFRHQIELTNEENIGSLILKCGTFSTTCPVTYPEGNTDESTIPSSAGTGVDVECTIRIIISDPYQDPELATYSYTIEFYASGGSPDLSGISIEAPAYQPLKINEEESEFTLIRKPEHLYGYTDLNPTTLHYYAWYDENGDALDPRDDTALTLSETPAPNDPVYSYNIGDDYNSVLLVDGVSVNNVSGNILYLNGTEVSFTRHSEYDFTPTLYAWTTNDYYDREEMSKPLTVYTHSENPSIDDQTYTSTGEIWDGKCWTGAEPGSLKFGTQISEISGNTITVGGIPGPKIVER